MRDLIVTIDRDPKSLSATATEADVEQFRIRLEDELGRALPGRAVRVATGYVVGYELYAAGPALTQIDGRHVARIWLDTAREFS